MGREASRRESRHPVSGPEPLGRLPERSDEDGISLVQLAANLLGERMEARRGGLLRLLRPLERILPLDGLTARRLDPAGLADRCRLGFDLLDEAGDPGAVDLGGEVVPTR